jgi:hypothetical protein
MIHTRTDDIRVGYIDSYMIYSSRREADTDKEIVLLGMCYSSSE